jgi:hypothetical protein
MAAFQPINKHRSLTYSPSGFGGPTKGKFEWLSAWTADFAEDWAARCFVANAASVLDGALRPGDYREALAEGAITWLC